MLQKTSGHRCPENVFHRVRNLEREIVRVDEEIDKRAYVLYGLNEEEVKIVEGS